MTNENDLFEENYENGEIVEPADVVPEKKKPKEKKPKEKKPKEKQPNKLETWWKGLTPLKQKLTIGGTIVGVIALMLVVKLFFFTDKGSYFADVKNIVTSDLGSFEYVFDIRTSEYKEQKIEASDYTQSELEGLENSDKVETETGDKEEGKHQGSIKDDWGNKDNISTDEWKYPNYKLVIKGQTLSTSPHKAYYNISLVTEYFNDALTEIYVIDGKYYINIEQLRYWLSQSQDAYLVSLGKELVEGSNWLVIDEKDFAYASRYAEDGEERNITSLFTLKENITTMANILLSNLENSVSSDSLSIQDNMKYFTLKNPADVIKKFKSLTVNSGDLYDVYIKNAYSEEDLKLVKKEKDNFIVALSDLAMIFNTKNVMLDMQGMTRTYSDNEGNNVIEATLNTAFSDGVVDYRVNISMLRSSKVSEITAPKGSSVNAKDYNSDIELLTNKLIDYFNFTDIKTEVKLNTTVDSIRKDIDNSFIKLFNETGLVYVTENNFETILKEYAEYDKDDKLEALVTEYYDLLKQEDVEVEQGKEKIETLSWGTDYKVDKNNELSNDKLLVYTLTGDLDPTLFSIKDGDNLYPCNNTTILTSYDKNFEIPENSLCFVISNSVNEFELYYDNELLGKLTR